MTAACRSVRSTQPYMVFPFANAGWTLCRYVFKVSTIREQLIATRNYAYTSAHPPLNPRFFYFVVNGTLECCVID